MIDAQQSERWERRQIAAQLRQRPSLMAAKKALKRLDKDALEIVAEAVIALLDEMSDPDEDCCLAGDDGCGVFYRDGIPLWGSHDEAGGSIIPQYGIDQTAGQFAANV